MGYQLAVNHLADKNELELKALRGKQYSPGYQNKGEPFPYDVEKEVQAIPENLDWRLYGAVTPVKGDYYNTLFYFFEKKNLIVEKTN